MNIVKDVYIWTSAFSIYGDEWRLVCTRDTLKEAEQIVERLESCGEECMIEWRDKDRVSKPKLVI